MHFLAISLYFSQIYVSETNGHKNHGRRKKDLCILCEFNIKLIFYNGIHKTKWRTDFRHTFQIRDLVR